MRGAPRLCVNRFLKIKSSRTKHRNMNFTIHHDTTEKLLAVMLGEQLNETEARIDNKEEMSPEFLADYINHALFLSKTYGRKGDRVEQAERLIMQTI